MRCFLFDLDGTLLDSRDSIINAILASVQLNFTRTYTRDELLGYFGESFDDFYKRILPYAHPELTREEFFKTYLYFLELYNDEDKLFPYVREGLLQLKLSGNKLGIVTNKQRNLVLKNPQFRSIASLFDTIVTVDDVVRGKPSPEPIMKAIHALRVTPKQVIMVGDSRYDVLAAHAAHVKSAIIDWYGLGEWGEPIPDYRFNSLSDLILGVYHIKESAK